MKFGRSNTRNFGALVEHKLNVLKANYIPRFYNLMWFYNTPEALITLKFKVKFIGSMILMHHRISGSHKRILLPQW